jgi:8-amino-7-oxononanoate synthase
MFSAAMPPAAVATVLECLRVVKEEPEIHTKLWKNARKMKQGLTSAGFDTLKSLTPIIPVVIGDDMQTFAFTKALYDNGVFATPVVQPAVQEGNALIRTSFMSTHTEEDLDYVLEVFYKLGKQFGMI